MFGHASISDWLPSCTLAIMIVVVSVGVSGCAGLRRTNELPSADQFSREQLRIHSDFRLPRRHRLVDELVARRRDIADRLLLPMSDEPINIFLFQDENRFRKYLRRNHPLFPNRRAFFVKNDTDLLVYAHWGDRVAEDLRHEVTHGYLHSCVPRIPLWMDEGLAEYFELPRGSNGLHHDHIFYLVERAKTGDWKPSLERLEHLDDAAGLTQQDYAESWLWVHYLMESDPRLRKALQDQLARVRMSGQTASLTEQLERILESDDLEGELVEHLSDLGEQVQQQENRS